MKNRNGVGMMILAACAGVAVYVLISPGSDREAGMTKARSGGAEEEVSRATLKSPEVSAGMSTGKAGPFEQSGIASENGNVVATKEAVIEGKEIDSGDPLVKKYVDEKGELLREIRNTPSGLPLTDTRYVNGQKATVMKDYSEDGTLVRVRRYENDRLKDTQELK